MRKETPSLAVPSVAEPGGLECIVLANPNILDERTLWLIAAEERVHNSRRSCRTRKDNQPCSFGLSGSMRRHFPGNETSQALDSRQHEREFQCTDL